MADSLFSFLSVHLQIAGLTARNCLKTDLGLPEIGQKKPMYWLITNKVYFFVAILWGLKVSWLLSTGYFSYHINFLLDLSSGQFGATDICCRKKTLSILDFMKSGKFHWKYLPKEIILFFLNSFFQLWIAHLQEPIVPNVGNFCIFQVISCFSK